MLTLFVDECVPHSALLCEVNGRFFRMSRSISSALIRFWRLAFSATNSACSRGSSVFFQLDRLAYDTPPTYGALASVCPGWESSFTASRLNWSSYVFFGFSPSTGS